MNSAETRFAKVTLEPLTQIWLETIAKIHIEAYATQTNFSRHLGPTFVKKTYEFFCEYDGRFGFVAFANGEPIGFVVGAEFEINSRLNKYRFITALRQVISNPRIWFSKYIYTKLIHKIITLFQPTSQWEVKFGGEECVSLYSLAVLPDFSRYRVANMLLQECEIYAREKGKKIILTSVGALNLSSLMVHRLEEYQVDKSKSNNEEIYLFKLIKLE